jgi:tRNA pseudouridine65 synthase
VVITAFSFSRKRKLIYNSLPIPFLEVLYEDEQYIAVHKPAGMLVHRTKLNSSERVYAMQVVRDQVGGHVFPVHRLDKPTSGALLFAKSSETARAVSELIQRHEMTKKYVGVVRGWTLDSDTIDYALKEQLDKTTDSKARIDKPAQEAVTEYHTIKRIELPHAVGRYASARYSLVEMNPQTGRKHQLRRHFKHIFHPILGDRKYGDRDHNAYWLDTHQIRRLCLAATELSFIHPYSGLPVCITTASDFPAPVLAAFEEPN